MQFSPLSHPCCPAGPHCAVRQVQHAAGPGGDHQRSDSAQALLALQVRAPVRLGEYSPKPKTLNLMLYHLRQKPLYLLPGGSGGKCVLL